MADALPGGLVATTWQDQVGLPTGRRLDTPEGTAFQQSYAYDAEDRLVAREDSRLGALRVDYDAEGQVLAFDPAHGPREHFAYDGAGNRISGPAGAARFNALNQMVAQGASTSPMTHAAIWWSGRAAARAGVMAGMVSTG